MQIVLPRHNINRVNKNLKPIGNHLKSKETFFYET
jgi:hypothetical protein